MNSIIIVNLKLIYILISATNKQSNQNNQTNNQHTQTLKTLSKHSQNTLKTLSQHTQKSHVHSIAPRCTLPLPLPD